MLTLKEFEEGKLVNDFNRVDDNGLKEGFWKEEDDSWAELYITYSEFKKDLPHGYEYTFYDNELIGILEYENGNLKGLQRCFIYFENEFIF